MKMSSPHSAVISSIGHDEKTGELHVVWKNTGKTSVYSNVSPSTAKTVMNSWSVHSALIEHVKTKNYPHRYKE